MRRLRVGVVDLVGNRPAPGLWNRLMKPNFAAIMPQVIAVWCEQMGHDVVFVCHTGCEDLARELPSDLDVLFIGAFTNAAHRARLGLAARVVLAQHGADLTTGLASHDALVVGEGRRGGTGLAS